LGEVNSHCYNIATYITGLQANTVSARLRTFAAGRPVYDNAYLTVEFQNGAEGRLWCSYAASGNDMGFRLRIFGETGYLSWNQESPEILVYKSVGGPATLLARGYHGLSADSLAVTRFRPGFPEGYALAFANIYADFAMAFMAHATGLDHRPFLDRLPKVEDGLEGLVMMRAATQSHFQGGAWQSLVEFRGASAPLGRE
jgi:predicted dehydrogenase